MSNPRVLIVTRDAELQRLAIAIADEGVQCELVVSNGGLERLLKEAEPCVCVVDANLPANLGSRTFELIRSSSGGPVVILSDAGGEDPFAESSEGLNVVDRIPTETPLHQVVLRLKAVMILAGFDAAIGPVGPPHGASAMSQSEDQHGKVVAVFSAKGGAGKSMLAVNLAAGLALHGRKSLIVDADLYFGDIALLLNMSPKKSLLNLSGLDALDSLSLQQLLTPHTSGVSVLASPDEPEQAECVTPDLVINAITFYRMVFDFVTVDMHTSFDEMNLQILEAADEILLVTTPELSAIYNTSRFLHIAEALGYRSKIRIVLNRADSGLALKAVEQSLGMAVWSTVVSAGRLAVSAANEGQPLLLSEGEGKGEIKRDLQQLVADMVGVKPAEPGRSPRTGATLLSGRLLSSASGLFGTTALVPRRA